ncbi:hypothetical protein [Deinococcus pimensis]|uniref:hypothetical protein n=1 Tax=Deinococcus pimensis TaxID=309888 RepID=UPI0012FC24E5|nr:hypothetical protein [Deinococcus pimensis]
MFFNSHFKSLFSADIIKSFTDEERYFINKLQTALSKAVVQIRTSENRSPIHTLVYYNAPDAEAELIKMLLDLFIEIEHSRDFDYDPISRRVLAQKIDGFIKNFEVFQRLARKKALPKTIYEEIFDCLKVVHK